MRDGAGDAAMADRAGAGRHDAPDAEATALPPARRRADPRRGEDARRGARRRGAEDRISGVRASLRPRAAVRAARRRRRTRNAATSPRVGTEIRASPTTSRPLRNRGQSLRTGYESLTSRGSEWPPTKAVAALTTRGAAPAIRAHAGRGGGPTRTRSGRSPRLRFLDPAMPKRLMRGCGDCSARSAGHEEVNSARHPGRTTAEMAAARGPPEAR